MSKPIPVQAQQAIMQAFALRDQNRLTEARNMGARILQSFPTEKNTLYLMGSIHAEMKELEKAEAYFKKGVNTDKGGHINQGGMGLTLLQKGDAKGALKWLKIARKRAPEEVSHLNNLALAQMKLGRAGEALESFSKVLQMMPAHGEAALNLAELLRNLNRGDEAEAIYRQGLQHNPGDVDLLRSFGEHLTQSGDFPGAEQHFEKALSVAPEHMETLRAFTEFLIQNGDIEKAVEMLRRILTADPVNLFALSNLMSLKRTEEVLDGPLEDTLERCHKAIRQGMETRNKDIMWHFHASEIEEKRGDYALAFQCLDHANRLNRDSLHALGYDYDKKTLEKYLDDLESFSHWQTLFGDGFGIEEETPVFVFGMPRSGTTLTEQIIAAHPQAAGAGERPELWDIVHDLSPQPFGVATKADWTRAMLAGGRQDRKAMADRYLARYREDFPEAVRVVDKLPYNFLYVGFAAALFPQAKFIFCRRNRSAVGLSIYKQRFVAPYVFDTDLGEIDHLYRIHDALMEFWLRLLPDRIHVLDYEALVSDPGAQAQGLIAFIGLPWSDDCLQFHKSRKRVQTASMHQVRQPVYTSSKEKYRHYAPFLGPMAPLDPDPEDVA